MECKNTGRSPLYYYISKSRHRQAVIFIHAAFADHTEFDPQIEVFSKYFTVITVDLIGHGLATKTKKGDGIEHTSEYLKDILSAENIEKAHFIWCFHADNFPLRITLLCASSTGGLLRLGTV